MEVWFSVPSPMRCIRHARIPIELARGRDEKEFAQRAEFSSRRVARRSSTENVFAFDVFEGKMSTMLDVSLI